LAFDVLHETSPLSSQAARVILDRDLTPAWPSFEVHGRMCRPFGGLLTPCVLRDAITQSSMPVYLIEHLFYYAPRTILIAWKAYSTNSRPQWPPYRRCVPQ
jgi:hypothetical protein